MKRVGALYQAVQPLPFWQTYRWSMSPLQYRKHFPGVGGNTIAVRQGTLPLCPAHLIPKTIISPGVSQTLNV